jgi:hypothetical protein
MAVSAFIDPLLIYADAHACFVVNATGAERDRHSRAIIHCHKAFRFERMGRSTSPVNAGQAGPFGRTPFFHPIRAMTLALLAMRRKQGGTAKLYRAVTKSPGEKTR